jgi:hypothetical protein
MIDIIICPYCKSDPFEYVDVGSKTLRAIAISCCEKAVTEYYRALSDIEIGGNNPNRPLISDE